MSKQIQSVQVYSIADVKVKRALYHELRRYTYRKIKTDLRCTADHLLWTSEAGPFTLWAAETRDDDVIDFSKELQLLENTGIRIYKISAV